MAMNIAKLQSELQHVPDSALIGYVQSPNGQVPSYLALAELSRRKEVRNASQQPQQAPTQTVAQQTIAQAAPQPGVAALPVPDHMFQEKSMATGGIVAFEGGGGVGDYDPNYHGYPVDAPGLSEADLAYADAMHDSPIAQYGGKALKTLLAPAYVAGKTGIDYLSGLKPVWDPKSGKLIHQSDLPKPDPNAAYQAEGQAGLKSRADYLNANPNVSPAYTMHKADEADLTRQQKTAAFLKADAENQLAKAATQKANDAAIQAAIDKSTGLPSVEQKVSARLKQNAPSGIAAGFDKITANPISDMAGDYAALQKPEIDVQEQIKKYKESLGEDKGLAALKERLGKMDEKAAKEEETAPWMALAKAGLAMAGGKSQFALQNIAAGATEGLNEYSKAKDKLAAAEEKRFEIQSRLAQAQRAEDVAAAKFGWDSKEHREAQNDTVKLNALNHKASVASANETNRLAAETSNAKNALTAQSDLWNHEYQMGSLDVQRTSAGKLSDYETAMREAKQDPSNYKTVPTPQGPKAVFDIDKFNTGYRGLDIKQTALLAPLYDKLEKTFDPNEKKLIMDQIQQIQAGLGGTIPTAPTTDYSKWGAPKIH